VRALVEVYVTTISVPRQSEFDESGAAFDHLSSGLLAAGDALKGVELTPGTFAEGEVLRRAVDEFCGARQQTLEIYSQASRLIGELVRLTGETYTDSERHRTDRGGSLDSRIGAALRGLGRLHARLADLRRNGTSGAGTSDPRTGRSTTLANGVDGYAAADGGTTGGEGGPSVTVSSLADLKRELAGDDPRTIRLAGHLTGSGDIPVGSNKTIIGVGRDAGLTGTGLNLTGVHNVIIRNLNIDKVTAASGTGDAIHIENSHHVWIDHNDLSSDRSHGKDYYDGLVDITRGSDNVTMSWNRLHDHPKAILIGHSDDNAAEDSGKLRVTLHHNSFENINSRTPSVRFGTVEVYDNHFVGGSSGVHSRMGAQALVQNNVFSDVATPVSTTKDSVRDGFVNLSGNAFGDGDNKVTQVGSLNATLDDTLDPAAAVPDVVGRKAGPGVVT
jgi:pectate lyase